MVITVKEILMMMMMIIPLFSSVVVFTLPLSFDRFGW